MRPMPEPISTKTWRELFVRRAQVEQVEITADLAVTGRDELGQAETLTRLVVEDPADVTDDVVGAGAGLGGATCRLPGCVLFAQWHRGLVRQVRSGSGAEYA